MSKTTQCLGWSLPVGVLLLLAEGFCNNLVKRVNGGFMPVATSNGIIPAGYVYMTSDTHFKFLADIIRVNYSFFSIGDLFGYVGFLLSSLGLVYWGIVVSKSLIES
jgi:hypothetical protein